MAPNKKRTPLEKIKRALNKALNSNFVKKYTSTINKVVGYTWQYGKMAGVITWMFVSVMCITAVPLFLEMDREQNAIDAERRQVARLRERGYTAQQINYLQQQTSIPL